MFKVSREARSGASARKYREKGKCVATYAFPPDTKDPTGGVVIAVARRLTLELLGEGRTVPQLATTTRHGRLVVTTMTLSPGAVILLRDALDAVIEKAEIIEVSDETI